MLSDSANTMTPSTALSDCVMGDRAKTTVRPRLRDSTRAAQAPPKMTNGCSDERRATSCAVMNSTHSISVSAMLTIATAISVAAPGSTIRINAPIAAMTISRRHSKEKLMCRPFAPIHHIKPALMATTPSW